MKLQFTNGYRPRFDQISRILQYISSQEQSQKIPHQEIVTALGIPVKQIENLISMMTGFGLVYPRVTTLTPLGKVFIQWDPYFEKVETLWIIHYIVSSNPEWVVWYRIVNTAIPTQDRLDVDKVSKYYFSDLTIHFSERTISEKLPTEVGAVLASYTRTAFSRLNILQQEEKGAFIRSNPVDIPDLAILFCLLYFRDKYSPGSSAMNTQDICLAENSPGRVLNLPMELVSTTLGNLQYAGLVRLEKLANLDQVRFSDVITQESVLQRIYGGKDAD